MQKLKRVIKFFIVFATLLSGYLWFYNRQDQADYERLAFSDSKIDMFCEQWKGNYQRCLRKSLHRMISLSTPMQITKISQLIFHVYEIEKLRGKQRHNEVVVFADFIKNYAIFFDEIEEFTFSRDQLDLFQIVLFPYYRYLIAVDLSRLKKVINAFESRHLAAELPLEIQKLVQQFKRMDIGIFKDVL